MDVAINVDWVECFCQEMDNCGTPEYFISQGYKVKVYDYGTRMYRQVFDVYSSTLKPLYHITRNPYSLRGEVKNGIFNRGACHIKLFNNLLYENNWALKFKSFLSTHGYTIKCISRLDLCCDLQKFADGTLPSTLVAGYFKNKYHKVGQPHFKAIGTDRGDKIFNYVAWGSPASNVSSVMYNKSKEMREVKDKPYIRDQWEAAGFDMKKDTWRIEIKIKSGGRRLVDKSEGGGEILELTLDLIDTREKVKAQFLKYAKHYFKWKNAKEGVSKKNCKDKLLFDNLPQENWKPVDDCRSEGSTRQDKMVINYMFDFMKLIECMYPNESDEMNNALYKATSYILRAKRLYGWAASKE